MNDSEGSANTLWLGTGGNRDSPLFKDPEQLRRKFRAWMWPHAFEVSISFFVATHETVLYTTDLTLYIGQCTVIYL